MHDGMIRALRGEPTGLHWRILTAMLMPLALIYTVGLKAYLLPYRLGLRRRYRLGCIVVSVGNLSSGGTGKTGLVLSLTRALTAAGMRCCVLSRGYRGANESSSAIVSDHQGVLLDAAQAGDEAYLLARSLPGTPVVVGRDRRKSGQLALDRFDPDVAILDDGMQFYQLHRDVEITLLDAKRPFGNGLTLPAGILREPPGHLRRSDWVVLSGSCSGTSMPEGRLERLRRCAGHGHVVRGAYRATEVVSISGRTRLDTLELRGKPVATLCGLGNPGAFEDMAASLGARLVHRTRYPDHHVPQPGELIGSVRDAERMGAELVLITAKDAVKLPPIEPAVPIFVLQAVFEVEAMDQIVAMICRARGVTQGGSGDTRELRHTMPRTQMPYGACR